MKRYDLITPEGTRDLLFEDCLSRRDVEKKLVNIFESFGYSEVVTPGMEFYDVFSGNSRGFRQESLYKLTDSQGRLIVMRPDSTIPIARLVATRLKEAKHPLRLFYNQSIFENNALLKGRSDEIVQAGIELIGGTSLKRADYEVMCMAIQSLQTFDEDNFRFEIGHIGYFKELVSKLGVDKRTAEEVRLLISAKNFPALNDLLDGIADNQITRTLKQLPSMFGGVEVFDRASELYTNEKIDGILLNLQEVYNRISSLGCEGKILVDFGIVSHTDYYTGTVFKGYISGVGQSVLKGGRYDKLIGEFGKDANAVGFGISVDAIANFISKKGCSPKHKNPDVIVYGIKGKVVEAIAYAQKLAAQGLIVENSLFDTYEETEIYAKEKNIPKIIVVDDEIKEVCCDE
ncbi:MAG: ATP phosphoribosyltransferase regulatory subunit [Clostridiales bacterium]|nr:ATP phosphoribosyltransferase regulatory subunit [Clostridiales bacterium]